MIEIVDCLWKSVSGDKVICEITGLVCDLQHCPKLKE